MDDKKKIETYKNLRKKYAYIESLGFDIFAVILFGSQNYNLDIYIEGHHSDIDAYAIIVPGIENAVEVESPVSKEVVYENEKIVIKDIRLFFDLIQKQNPMALELLFSDFKIVNPLYKDNFKELFSVRDTISGYDKKSFIMACCGWVKEMYNNFNNGLKGISEKDYVFGYNIKSLINILRIHEMLYRLVDLKEPISKSLFQPLNIFENILEIKTSSMLLEDARISAVIYNDFCKKYADLEFEKSTENIPEILAKIKKAVIIAKIKNDLAKIEGTDNPKKAKVKRSGRVFVTSDLHFYHDNIIRYENRPFVSSAEMNKKLIENWNSVVNKNDTVYILGDLSFGDGEETNEVLKQLKGIKILIEGNHDLFLEDNKFDASLLDNISKMEEISYKGNKFFLCHYPLRSWKKSRHGTIHLYGHVHTKKEKSEEPEVKPISFNIGTDLNNYTPILLDDLLNNLKEEK